MASTDKSTPEQEHLAELDRRVVEVQAEAKRLNRRLRNARAAIQSIEDELATLAEQIQARLSRIQSSGPH